VVHLGAKVMSWVMHLCHSYVTEALLVHSTMLM
jgi:hypothetical protein